MKAVGSIVLVFKRAVQSWKVIGNPEKVWQFQYLPCTHYNSTGPKSSQAVSVVFVGIKEQVQWNSVVSTFFVWKEGEGEEMGMCEVGLRLVFLVIIFCLMEFNLLCWIWKPNVGADDKSG